MLNSDAARNDEGQSGALVIFARVEGLRRERTHDSSAEAGDPPRFVSRQGVPLVLVSAWEASEIRQLQRDVGLSQPFICEDARHCTCHNRDCQPELHRHLPGVYVTSAAGTPP